MRVYEEGISGYSRVYEGIYGYIMVHEALEALVYRSISYTGVIVGEYSGYSGV